MCSVTIFKILYQIHNHESDRVNVHTFCSPDLPLSGTLGLAAQFENQQDFLCAAYLRPARHSLPLPFPFRYCTWNSGKRLNLYRVENSEIVSAVISQRTVRPLEKTEISAHHEFVS